MDPIFAARVVFRTADASIWVLDFMLRKAARVLKLIHLYGLQGLVLLAFSNRTTWALEALVLGRVDDADARAFRTSIQEQCNTISVAGAIVAQIAVTALTLAEISKTHWVARGFLSLSLMAALMAVYCASAQHRMLGHMLEPRWIRQWIRHGMNARSEARIISALTREIEDTEMSCGPSKWCFDVGTTPYKLQLCDPDDLIPRDVTADMFKDYLRRSCFAPNVFAVIIVSAPQALLSSSLFSLFIALGVYFGFVWTWNLDHDASSNDSRNVFIMYVVSLSVCLSVYMLSQLVKSDDPRSELDILDDHIKNYLQTSGINTEDRWGVSYSVDARGVHFAELANRNGNP